MLRQITSRFLHSTTKAAAKNTVLYGWGQTQALPLTKGHIDRVFNQPTQLDKQDDYALPVSSRFFYFLAQINSFMFEERPIIDPRCNRLGSFLDCRGK